MPLFPGHPMMMPGAFPMISPNFPVNQNLMGQKNFPHQMMPQIQQQQKNTENQPQISSANSIQQNLNLILNNANNNFAAMQKNLINPMQTKPQSPSSVEKSKILDQSNWRFLGLSVLVCESLMLLNILFIYLCLYDLINFSTFLFVVLNEYSIKV